MTDSLQISIETHFPSQYRSYTVYVKSLSLMPEMIRSSFDISAFMRTAPLQEMYDISYLWYGFITMGITILLGVVVSLMSG